MTLYLEYFGLTNPPFRITPHPDYFFSGAGRGAALDALVYAVTSGEGLIKVSAEVGAGKTMLCRMLLERLPKHIDAIFLPNPLLNEDELLLTLADELGITYPSDTSARAGQKIRLIEAALIERFALGRQVVVLIDEAHAMPNASLELVRLLSNLDSGHHKLLQIVLFGQLELDQKLREPELNALRERISYHLTLPPLSQSDVADYLACRLYAAGHTGSALFSVQAIKHIAYVAQGLSRRVNLLADKALLAAFAEDARQVSMKHAQLAEKECAYRRSNHSIAGFFNQRIFVLIGLLVLAAAMLSLFGGELRAASPALTASSSASANANLAALSASKAAEIQAIDFSTLYIRSRQQLNVADAGCYTVLIAKLPSSKTEQLNLIVASLEQQLGPGRVMLSPVHSKGEAQWNVMAGLYPDRAQAQVALQKILGNKLPYKGIKPQIRTVGTVRNESI